MIETSSSELKNEAIITIENLHCGYRAGKKWNEICFASSIRINSGTVTALMGANGSGKSTFLKTISGHLPPIGGKLAVKSEPYDQLSSKEFARLVAVVFTGRAETGYLTVKETAALGRTPWQHSFFNTSKKTQPIVETALAQTGLTQLQDRKAASLSDGEYRRLMIARALVQDTPVLLLDEPLAYLDPGHKAEMLLLLKKLARLGKAILFSTHEPGFSLQVADELILIDFKGKLEQNTISQILKGDQIERIFNSNHIRFDPASRELKMI